MVQYRGSEASLKGRFAVAGEVHVATDGHRATAQLHNPGKRNALDTGMWSALRLALEDLTRQHRIRVIVLREAPSPDETVEVFSSGADFQELLRHVEADQFAGNDEQAQR